MELLHRVADYVAMERNGFDSRARNAKSALRELARLEEDLLNVQSNTCLRNKHDILRNCLPLGPDYFLPDDVDNV